MIFTFPGFRTMVAVAMLLATTAAAAQSWIGAWGASPSAVAGESLKNQTIRQVVHLDGGGRAIRLRLSNALSGAPLVLGDAKVARPSSEAGGIEPGSDMPVKFGGRPGVFVPVHATVLSDPIPLRAATGAELSVSLFVVAGEGPTVHELGLETAFVVPGDQTSAAILADATVRDARVALSGIEAEAFAPVAGTIVALGVVDAGISGNRLLRDGAGPNALARLPRDVLAMPGLRAVCILEGINDILHGASDPTQRVTAADLIAGYQQIIAQVHEHGAKVLIGTLTPFSGSGPAEQVRAQVNAWIRARDGFEGVLDFDAALRDPRKPSQFLARFDSGDHLHPNDDGYAAMANAIDLDLLR